MSIPCKMRPVGSGLPAGYKRVEYLESTGKQYIDTEYIPNNETGIYLYQLKTKFGDYMPMGCRNNSSTNTRFYALRPIITGTGDVSTGFGWGDWAFYNTHIRGLSKTYLNYMNARVAVGENTVPRDLRELPFTPEYSIFMFAANIGGEPSLLWSGRIYEAAISQGESIVMSFVPCLDPNNRPCMFDTVSKKPFYNAATTGSDFLYG